jgi:hypothetical protein
VLHTAGKYKPEIPHGSDFEMWLRLATLADVGRVNGAHQGYYRIHAQSMQRSIENIYLRDLQVNGEIFTRLFAEAGAVLPDAPILARTARRAVAADALAHACRWYDEGREHVEPVDACVELAQGLWPQASTLRQWHALERRRAARSRSIQTRLAKPARRRLNDLEARVRWRRWRWTGI